MNKKGFSLNIDYTGQTLICTIYLADLNIRVEVARACLSKVNSVKPEPKFHLYLFVQHIFLYKF